jgi:hypothetical protein
LDYNEANTTVIGLQGIFDLLSNGSGLEGKTNIASDNSAARKDIDDRMFDLGEEATQSSSGRCVGRLLHGSIRHLP